MEESSQVPQTQYQPSQEALSQQPTTQPSYPPSSRSKVPFIVGGVLILLLVAGGAYYLGMKNNGKPVQQTSELTSQVVSQPTQPTDETANWKTYTDAKNGFSFKYPNDWDTYPFSGIMIIAPQDVVASAKKLQGGVDGGKWMVSDLQVKQSSSTFTSDAYQSIVPSKITVGGKEGTLYTITVTKPSPLGEVGDKVLTVEVSVNGKFIQYDLLDAKYQSVFNQILSTFQFTDQKNIMSGWKSISSTRCQFQIQIPSDWKIQENVGSTQAEGYNQLCLQVQAPDFAVIPQSDGFNGLPITIMHTKKGSSFKSITINTLSDYVKAEENVMEPATTFPTQPKTIGSFTGLTFDNTAGQNSQHEFIFEQGNYIYSFLWPIGYTGKYLSSVEDIIKTIQ